MVLYNGHKHSSTDCIEQVNVFSVNDNFDSDTVDATPCVCRTLQSLLNGMVRRSVMSIRDACIFTMFVHKHSNQALFVVSRCLPFLKF